MLNYEVDAGLLRPFVPPGVELDSYDATTLVSLVGFRFLHSRVWGLPVPFHRDFDEVNLRFYVRRREGAECRRGVVFIREVVPKRAVAALARLIYNERYLRLPMRHSIRQDRDEGAEVSGIEVNYSWRLDGRWSGIYAGATGDSSLPGEGSLEQFITEHYWGYAA